MCPDRPLVHSLHAQRGIGLPIALFVITVLALLVVGMAQLQESSGKSVSLQIQSQRAFFAAESAAQVAVTQMLAPGSSGCSDVSSSLSFSAYGLHSCAASLSCTSVTADIDGDSAVETVFTIHSNGQCGAGDEIANRYLEVRVR